MITFLIILVFLFTVYAGLILYFRKAWQSIPFTSPGIDKSVPLPFLSIIVPARNEENNIGSCLEALGAQDYPADRFEVLVVDDHSEDGTADIIRAFLTRFPHIRYISLREMVKDSQVMSYKKKAIEAGIAISRGELIITTDADCRSAKQWLSTIARVYLEEQLACLVMPVRIDVSQKTGDRKPRLLSIFQALDVLTLQGITGAVVSQKRMGMCNGANFAYTRQVYDTVGGFRGNENVASGDDMFLLHKISALYSQRVRYLKSAEVIVDTSPERTLQDFIQQRIRWAGKSAQYKDRSILPILVWVYFFNLLLLAGLSLPVWNPSSLYNGEYTMILIVFFCKILVEGYFLLPVARFFGQQSLLVWFPLMQIPHILYTVIMGWLGMFGRYQWKGRSVR